jgi:hypothetical protein
VSLLDGFALRASKLCTRSSTIYAIEHLPERGILDSFLQLIEDHVQELLGILLHTYIHWVAVEVFEAEAKLIRVIFLPFSELQICKHALELMQKIIVDFLEATLNEVLWLLIVGHQEQVPEGFGHVELLNHGDHVTDTTKVSYACIPKLRAYFVEGVVIVVAVGLHFLGRHSLVDALETRLE